MKKAWVENGKVRDIAKGNPDELYHPGVAVKYSTNVPDNAENGDLWDGVTLTKPVITPPQAGPVTYRSISRGKLMLLFTSEERVKARSIRKTDPILDDFWLLLEGMDSGDMIDLNLTQVQGGIEYVLTVVKAGGINIDAQARKAAILSGA